LVEALRKSAEQNYRTISQEIKMRLYASYNLKPGDAATSRAADQPEFEADQNEFTKPAPKIVDSKATED
jgi:hypothetical protein